MARITDQRWSPAAWGTTPHDHEPGSSWARRRTLVARVHPELNGAVSEFTTPFVLKDKRAWCRRPRPLANSWAPPASPEVCDRASLVVVLRELAEVRTQLTQAHRKEEAC